MLKRSQNLSMEEGLSDHFHTSNNLGRITNIYFQSDKTKYEGEPSKD